MSNMRLLKGKISIKLLITTLLIVSSVILCAFVVFAAPDKKNDSSQDKIEILVEDREIEYIEELKGIEYNCTVRVIFGNGSQDLIDGESVIWSSSDVNIAEIKSNGAIMPKSSGMVTIFAEYNGLKCDKVINISKGFIKKLDLSNNKLKLKHLLHNKESKNPYSLIAVVTTSSGANYDVTENSNVIWSSSDKNVLAIDQGRIYSLMPGSANINASFGGYNAVCRVDADNAKLEKITKQKGEIIIKGVGTSVELPITALFSDGSNDSILPIVTYETDNHKVAEACNGSIYAVGEGVANIKVTFKDYSDTIVVKVKNEEPINNDIIQFP